MRWPWRHDCNYCFRARDGSILPTVFSSNDPGIAELVRRCVAGEASAWDDFVERFGRLVYSVPRRYGLDDATCEDVLQAVFVAAFQHLARLNDPAKVSAWLLTSAHRESWRIGRARGAAALREGAMPLAEQLADVGSPAEEELERWDRQDRVRAALEEIGERCRELLRALYFARGEARYEAISEQLGMPIGSIGPTRARCLQKLEQLLRLRGFCPDNAALPVEPR